MAWLETKKNGEYNIRFRFAGAKPFVCLKTSDKREAESALVRFESHLRLIEQGFLSAPSPGADIGTYILSGGKLNGRPSRGEKVTVYRLSNLFDSYLANYPKGSKEASTLKTERIHVGHFRRLFDTKILLLDISTRTIQSYVDARVKDVGSETVKKEIGTFATIWNKWAVPQGMVGFKAPTSGLVFPKSSVKPPFQTREQIERQLAGRNYSQIEENGFWEGLFLTLADIEEVLEVVRLRRGIPQAYPMFVFAAHTGARRSEIRRALVTDLDFESKTVMIREKKRERDKRETYRIVPMSPKFEVVMREWFAVHPGGQHALCTMTGNPITEHYSTKLIVNTLKGSKWRVIPGWHCFRHSFITNCAARGVDQRLIDQWVGHTTEAMRRRYRHLVPAVSQRAILSVFG